MRIQKTLTTSLISIQQAQRIFMAVRSHEAVTLTFQGHTQPGEQTLKVSTLY